MDFEKYMDIALREAKRALTHNDTPIGAIIIKEGKIISKAHNTVEKSKDSTLHAEIVAIKKASKKLNNWRLNNCIMFVTCEPCVMCAGAIIHARIKTLVYGCPDIRWGAFGSIYDFSKNNKLNHAPEIISLVKSEDSAKLLKDFFSALRKSV
jgi:tRNA(adenine34) deaminase